VHDLAEKLRHDIERQELFKAGHRVGVAVSGGADSVALLRLLLELHKPLGLVLSVVHFNHRLRAEESDADEAFVAELAAQHHVEFYCASADVRAHAAQQHRSIEAAARDLRYDFFWRVLKDKKLDRLATAHTVDDQAETVLLRIARGAGTRGLAGIYPRLSVPSSQFSDAAIIRPLLGIRREEIELYLKEIGQEWREDRSNRDLRFARNRVRHGILPRLERNLNPSIREALAEAAEISRAEEEYWQAELVRILPTVCDATKVNVASLAKSPLALRRRILRAAAEQSGLRLEFAQVEEILRVASGEEKSARLAAGWTVRRVQRSLIFQPPAQTSTDHSDYEHILPVPGRVEVPQAGAWFEAALARDTAEAAYNRGNSWDRALLAGELIVRNWRAGDRFWPAHTKQPRKIKELLQERHISGAERKRWPVIVSGNEVVWLRGFSAPASFRAGEKAEAVVIRELPLRS
jgi:tRNA(Ile)-lysidine synthase